MKINDLEILTGENLHQNASIEENDKMLDYSTSRQLTFSEVLGVKKGLDIISEFFDVNAIVLISGVNVCAVALGKSLEEAMLQTINSNPVDFVNSIIVASAELTSDLLRGLKGVRLVVAPKFTSNAIKYLESYEIGYVEIYTPLKDYKQYLANETFVTPLGTLTQTPNLSELNKDTFKVVSKTKPTVEQIEDAVFAWKISKHVKSQAIVVAKDLRTSAISQGGQMYSVEKALDNSCEMAKDAVLACDGTITVQDLNAAIQCRIRLIIIPSAKQDLVEIADKYNVALITTGITNILY